MQHAAMHGAPLPEPPRRSPHTVANEFFTRRRVLSDRRTDVMRERTPELLETMTGREAELLAEATELSGRLDEIADELGDLVRTVQHVTGLAPGLRGDQPVFALTRVEVPMLWLACQHGWRFVSDPVAPAPKSSATFTIVNGG